MSAPLEYVTPLDRLAATINESAAAIRRGDTEALTHALASGQAQAEAKLLLKKKRGAFGPWVAENCPGVKKSQAAKYLYLHKHRAQIPTGGGGLSIRQACAAIKGKLRVDQPAKPPRVSKPVDPHQIEVLREHLGTFTRRDTDRAVYHFAYDLLLAQRCGK